MMTRSKRKRTARKDRSSPKKSNQKYCTVPANDAVEVGDMLTMDQGGTSGSLHDYDLTPDYRQVAWLLREKLNELVDGDQAEFPESGLRSLLDMAAARNIISVDPKMLNPVLWRTIPKELLVLVLARLPLPDIFRLRSLSREWRRELATVNSDINQAFDEASSTMVALVSHTFADEFLVSIYDITKSRWQDAYHLRLRKPVPWNLPPNYNDLEPAPHTWTPVHAACDGGLMCFISLWKPTKHNRLSIAVVNLLTRVQHELPPMYYKYNTLPAMVQIKVDSQTKCYEVVVAAYRAGGRTIETYDSGTRKWTRAVPPSGSISGPVHTWFSANGCSYKLSSLTPGAYDFGEGKLQLYTNFQRVMSDWVQIDMAVEEDRVFDLQEQTQMDAFLGRRIHHNFRIIEYHLDNRTKAWVKGKSYECPRSVHCEVVEMSTVRLNACDGFLMLIFHYDQRARCLSLLDLSTGEWSDLQEEDLNCEGLHTPESVMCRAFWNVIP